MTKKVLQLFFRKTIPSPRLLRTAICLIAIGLISNTYLLNAQSNPAQGDTYVDNNGVIRWSKTKEEVHGFGVNYTVPFAHAFRSAKRMKVDIKEEIDNDVYHFSRLGFDLYRVHVWDTEISDTLGNLVYNSHLEAFDYLIKKLKEKGINYVLTPIAFWGNGWPEPDEVTPGFSYKYGKGKSLTDPGAIEAGQNYLAQFLDHVNPYTGIAYKNDPSVIAFEISNEPHHGGEAEKVTEYVKGMVKAMKQTGTKKPIFYNISHSIQFEDAYFKGGVTGGTFQWYPTGLTYQKELSGNLLPNANDYNIPFEETIKKHKGAKIVYEFDAADVGGSYMYPALARSFRKAGIQIATQFAYDPTYLAYANTEYNTHFMNLSYTPQKALSLMIAGEVFHKVPMYTDFGPYPENTSFGDFQVDYKNDLALYNGADKFIYTNNTNVQAKSPSTLQRIAGYGNSQLVKYDGQGAYFLDKTGEGTWRLEVMPDAIWVDNPFGKNSPKKTVAVVKWAEHQMQVNLNQLGAGFSVETINEGNIFSSEVNGNSFSVRPGTYILTKKGTAKNWKPTDAFGNNQLKDFYAPATNVKHAWLKHEAPAEITEKTDLELTVQYVAPEQPESIRLLTSGFRARPIDMVKTDDYHYTATVPADRINVGTFTYRIVVTTADGKTVTYPSGMEGNPAQWDFYDLSTYSIRVAPKSNSILLFSAQDDAGNLLASRWSRGFMLTPMDSPWESEYKMNFGQLINPQNPNANPDFSFKHFILSRIEGRTADLASKKEVVVKGRSLTDKPTKLQIAFTLDDGAAYGAIIELDTEMKEYSLSLSDFKPVKTVTLPRPYPDFLPYYLEHDITSGFDISRIETLQLSVGPGMSENELKEEQGIGLVNIKLK